MLNWVITFFLMAVVAAVLGFGGLAGTFAEIAKACGTSNSYLSRKFHQQIGVSLTRYRNSLRLSRFFEEYHRADQPTITEAVYAAGFGSYAQFYKVFSQVYGRGPRSCLRNDSVPIGKPIP